MSLLSLKSPFFFIILLSICVSISILPSEAKSLRSSKRLHYQKLKKDTEEKPTAIHEFAEPITEQATEPVTEGLISSVWHKIKNVFSSDTTSSPAEEKTTIISVALKDSSNRKIRMVPPEMRKGHVNHDVRRWQSQSDNDEENPSDVFPVVEHHHFDPSLMSLSRTKMQRNAARNADVYMPNVASFPRTMLRHIPENVLVNGIVRSKPIRRTKRSLVDSYEVQYPHMFFDEFVEGGAEAGRIRRELPNKEIISVGSDPVENIDYEHFNDESEKNNEIIKSDEIPPVIVAENETIESSTAEASTQELPPLQVIEDD